jgi:hypothetical protein
MYKDYAQADIAELQQMGYFNGRSKEVFLCHYKYMKRIVELEPNVSEFAKLVDEFERALNREYNPNDPNEIFVGHLRDRIKKTK